MLDPFAGGGTVLIAAEQSGRRCFAMEGDPLKCDLIVMRWEQFTGEKAVRLGAADARGHRPNPQAWTQSPTRPHTPISAAPPW